MNQETDCHLLNYCTKSIELKILKDILHMNINAIQKSKVSLEVEQKKLENLNYAVWAAENGLCDKIWNSAYKYKFHEIFLQYPCIIKPINDEYQCICKKQDSRYDDLSNETEAIREKIRYMSSEEDIKSSMKTALTKLQKLQTRAEEITELLRLVNISKTFYDTQKKPVLMVTKHKLTSQNEQVADSKMNQGSCVIRAGNSKVKKHKQKPAKFTEKKPSTIYKQYGRKRETSGNFIMKKRSIISLKFEQHRKCSI